jgi:hypothetical protein
MNSIERQTTLHRDPGQQESVMPTTFILRGACSLALGAALLAASPAQAMRTSVGDIDMSLQNRISFGIAFRTESPDSDLLGIANGGEAFSTNFDDANQNFDSTGEPFTAPLKLLSDFSADWNGFTLFARGGFGFDGVLHRRNNFDRSDYGPGKEASLAELEAKNDAVRSEVGRYAELLDLHISASHRFLGRSLSWKLGRQIINWGESTFIQNGLNAIVAANANRAGVPGAELEEVFVPTANLWAAMDLTSLISAEAWYQLQWERTEPFASGTFFSTNDFVAAGGTRANLGFGRVTENSPPGTPCAAPPFPGNPCVPFGSSIPRTGDDEPSDSGQFGGALRFFVPALAGADIGLYATRYHSRLPLISGISRTDATATSQTAAFRIDYPEDIQMFGASASFQGPFGTSIQAEYSYKIDQPLQLDDVEILLAGLGAPNQIVDNTPLPTSLGNQYIRGWRRHDVHQAILAFTQLFGPNTIPGSSQTVWLFETGYTRVNGLPDNDELRYEAPGTPLPGNAAIAASQGLPVETGQFATTSSWGYRTVVASTYNNVLGGMNVTPSLRFDHDVNGMTPSPLGNFVDGRKQVATNLKFDYLSTWQFDVGYTMFFGGGKQNLLADRDFVQLALRYAF